MGYYFPDCGTWADSYKTENIWLFSQMICIIIIFFSSVKTKHHVFIYYF